VTQWLWTWRCAALSCVLVVIFLAIVVITTVYFNRHPVAPVFPEIPDPSLEGNCPSEKFFMLQTQYEVLSYRDCKIKIYNILHYTCIYSIYSSNRAFLLFFINRILYISLHFYMESNISNLLKLVYAFD